MSAGRTTAQREPDLIDRAELLALIRDQAAKVKDADPRQHAVLAYWQTVVEALPAVDAVPVVRCGECMNWKSARYPSSPHWGMCGRPNDHCARKSSDFCSKGVRMACHEAETTPKFERRLLMKPASVPDCRDCEYFNRGAYLKGAWPCRNPANMKSRVAPPGLTCFVRRGSKEANQIG